MSLQWFSVRPAIRKHLPDRLLVSDYYLESSQGLIEGMRVDVQSRLCGDWGVEYVGEFEAEQNLEAEFSVGFSLQFPDSSMCHVAIPAAAYEGNRFRSKPFPYPCIVSDPEDFRADLPNTISNVPRMPRLQVLAGDTAMPAIGIADFAIQRAVLILTDPQPEAGQPLLEVLETYETEVSILTPGVRGPERYSGCGETWLPSEDLGWKPRAGERTRIRIRVHEFEAESPNDLYSWLFDLRHEIWPAGGRHELPWSAAFEIQEAKYQRENWDPERHYYAVGDRQSRYAHWQIGWVGGGIASHALLAAGNQETKERALEALDFIADRGQSPSGFYWSVGIEDEMFSDMVDMDWGHDWHLIRRSGDALYFFCKQYQLAKAMGKAKESWRESIRLCADAFIKLWEIEGQFGQFVSQETGLIQVGSTASGAIAPAGLALASNLFDDARYLHVAESSARYYVSEFLNKGFTSGGPGEASQCPDSESAFGLLESLVTLFEVTGDDKWLGPAKDAAHLCASWVMPYDFRFPEGSSFHRLDMRTTGSVWANVQNKHSAPGICTLSGVSLLKLFRATGDKRCLELLKEIAHGVTQYLSRSDRPVFDMPEGWMCERVNTSDWEHPGVPVGEGFAASCWCEVASLLTFAEAPGLYVQPDTGYVVALDNIDGEALAVADDVFEVRLTNPTKFDADVRVMAEPSTALSTPLGQDFALGLPIVAVPAESSVVVRMDKVSGQVL